MIISWKPLKSYNKDIVAYDVNQQFFSDVEIHLKVQKESNSPFTS
jgi:hypothetical protein